MRGRRGRARQDGCPAAGSPQALLHEAIGLQQRAERRGGQEAIAFLQQAVTVLHRLLQLHPSHATQAMPLLGECYHFWGRAVLDDALKTDNLTLDGETAAITESCKLYEQATDAYTQAVAASGFQDAESTVNCANALCELCELRGGDPMPLLDRALELYTTALRSTESAEGWRDLADCQCQRADALLQAGRVVDADQALAAGVAGYQRAVALCDSANGDDLPGLLYNWGAALCNASSNMPDPAARGALLLAAEGRLRESVSFQRADTAPMNALGDVLAARAELAAQAELLARAELAAQGERAVHAGPTAHAELAGGGGGAEALLAAALSDGYGAALAVDRSNTDALVGVAEVHAVVARLRRRNGDMDTARQLSTQSADAYAEALRRPGALGRFADRRDVRFNWAVSLAHAGRAPQAAEVLEALAQVSALTAADLNDDEDLMELAGAQWLQALKSQLAGRG